METMLVATQADLETVQGLFPDAVLLGQKLGTTEWFVAMNMWRIAEGLQPLPVRLSVWNIYRMVDPDKNDLPYWAEDVWAVLDGFEAV